jgi:hypothetical protein
MGDNVSDLTLNLGGLKLNKGDLFDQRHVLVNYEWLLEDGSWIPYSKEHREIIAEKDKKKTTDDYTVEIETDGKSYRLEFKEMIQTNIKSKTTRPFRRVHCWASAGPLIWTQFVYTDQWQLISVPFEGPTCFSPEVADTVRALRQACPDYDIKCVEINYNPAKWLNYSRLREAYRRRIPKFEERYLWHG